MGLPSLGHRHEADEVIAYEDLMRLGSEARCREAGKLRLEGKYYVVRDGDIVHFRSAVQAGHLGDCPRAGDNLGR